MQFIDLKKQYQCVKSSMDQAVLNVLEHGQYIMGPEVSCLEQTLSDYIGVKHVIANSSGTDALLMSLMALGVGPGDEVITTPFSFFATAEVIMLLQAKPVFVDVEKSTCNIDANLIEAAITDKTKAIIPVALYGQCADMDAINQIASRHNIAVIEDAAQSFGATYQGKQSCGLSTIGCTSFFPSKPLGCYGDGGACFTNDDEIAEKLKQIRIHGQAARYQHPLIGLNARMDSIQAAVLIEKMKLFPQEVILRQQVAERYHHLLKDYVQMPQLTAGNTSVYAQFTILVENREHFVESMKQHQIPTAVHYPVPMHLQPSLANLGFKAGDFAVSEYLAKHVVSLPMHPYLEESEQLKVVEAVKACCKLTADEMA